MVTLKLESTNWMVWVINYLDAFIFSRRGWSMLEMVLIAKIRTEEFKTGKGDLDVKGVGGVQRGLLYRARIRYFALLRTD